MENLFQPYTGQQVAPLPPGYLETINQGNQALANGISSLGQNIGQGIQQWKQNKLQAKAADYMVKSYDTKDPNTGDVKNPLLDQMGVHPEEWDTLSAPQKTMAVQGLMKGMAMKSLQQEQQAKTQEMQARTQMLQQNADEADAMGKIAPVAQAWQTNNPGKQPGAADILSWMGSAKLNPRTQSAIMAKLIPGMMGGEGSTAYQFDPSKVVDLTSRGLPGKFFVPTSKGGGQVLNSNDINSLMGQTITASTIVDADGKVIGQGLPTKSGGITPVKNQQTRPLPETYSARAATLADNLDTAQQRLDNFTADPEGKTKTINGPSGTTKPADLLKKYQADVENNKTKLKNWMDSHKDQGFGDQTFWDSEYKRYGFGGNTSAVAGKGAPVASNGTGKTFIQNSHKFATQPDGTVKYIGAAQ